MEERKKRKRKKQQEEEYHCVALRPLSTHAAAPVLQLSPAANEAFAIVETHTEDVFTRICQDQKH